MRRLVAVLALVVLAGTLTACGGGDAGTGTTTGSGEATAPVTPPPAASANASDTKSPKEIVSNEQFPTDKTQVPEAVLDRLAAKQAMLIFFYDSTQVVTKDERVEVDAVVAKYRGLIDFLSYDLRSGLGSKDTTAAPELAKAFDMAGLIGVKHTPYILFVDRYGRITGRFADFTDRALLEREVLRATE